jgi:predicted alpha/beta hydrolase family esterase
MPPKPIVFFLHSAGPQGPHEGSGDFLGHIKKGLGPGFVVKAPKMPRPDAPHYGRWKAKLDKLLPALKGEVILIGHSLGGSVLLKYLSEEKVRFRISALCLAATPFWGEKGWEYEMFRLKDGFAKKLPALPRIFLYHSRDDEMVAFGHVKRYAKELPKAEVRALKNGGHAFEKGLPELIEDVKSAVSGPRRAGRSA